MGTHKWLNEENGNEMLLLLKDLKKQIRDLPLSGSLATAGIGKRCADIIESKAKKLKIPKDEAIEYFFSMLKQND